MHFSIVVNWVESLFNKTGGMTVSPEDFLIGIRERVFRPFRLAEMAK